MREVTMTGKTVEEATELALAQLGVSSDNENVTVEVLELPQRKLFRSVPAKVRVCVEEQPRPAPSTEQPARPAVEPEQSVSQPVPVEAESNGEKQIEEPDEQPEEKMFTDPEEPFDLSASPKAMAAAEYLRGVAACMGVQSLEIGAVKQGETIILKAAGENASVLIGHRGEVMEALSYLCSLCANRMEGDYAKIGVDINGYRARREANLVQLARRIGAKVARTGRSHMLEPMNPYERRIIHSAITEMEGVRSESTGEGSNRRVVILSTLPNAKPGAPRRENPRRDDHRRERRGGKGRGDRARRDHEARSSVPAREFAGQPRNPDAEPVALRRSETINDAEGMDLPLYGKIEL